jgi:hypothetical protein
MPRKTSTRRFIAAHDTIDGRVLRILLFHDGSPFGLTLADALAGPTLVVVDADEIAELEGDVALLVTSSEVPLVMLRQLPFGAFEVRGSLDGVAIHRLGGGVVARGAAPVDVVADFLERLERCDLPDVIQ